MKKAICAIIVFIVFATLVSLWTRTGTKTDTGYQGQPYEEGAREYLENAVGRKAWGINNVNDNYPRYKKDLTEVSFSSFVLVGDYRWEVQGVVKIPSENYEAYFTGIVGCVNLDFNIFSWKCAKWEET